MKKPILSGMLCIMIFAALPCFAQDPKNDNSNNNEQPKKKPGADIATGLEGGFNFANIDMQGNGNISSYNYKTGARIGFVIDAPLTGQLYLQPGLFYAGNGTRATYTYPTTGGYTLSSASSSLTITALEVPVNLVYKSGQQGGNRFFVGAGAYIGYNVHAKSVDVATSGPGSGMGPTNTYTLKIGSQNGADDIKATDLGVGVTAGYELAMGAYFRFRYQKGLSNMSPNDGYTIHTTSIGLQVGCMFYNKHAVTGDGVKKERVKKVRARSAVQED